MIYSHIGCELILLDHSNYKDEQKALGNLKNIYRIQFEASMSLIYTISSLHCSRLNPEQSFILSLTDDSFTVNLSSYFDRILTKPPSNSTSLPRSLFEELHFKARLETDDGRRVMEYVMPPSYEMMYRQKTICSLLKKEENLSVEEMYSPERRDDLVNWLVKLHGQCGYKVYTLHQAVTIINRFFCYKNIAHSRDKLLGASALWIARKMEETKVYKLKNYVKLLGCFSIEDIVVMEAYILDCFNFDLLYPTSYIFLYIMSTYFIISQRSYALSCYLLELALIDGHYLQYSQGLLAVSALFLSLKILDPTQWNDEFLSIANTNEYCLLYCSTRLLLTLQSAHKNSLDSAFQKYSKKYNYRISKIRFWPPIE